MLFSEFIDGTKLPPNWQTFALYQSLEQLYMIDDTPAKADIYLAARDIAKIFDDIEHKWFIQASLYRNKLILIRGMLEDLDLANNRQEPDKERK